MGMGVVCCRLSSMVVLVVSVASSGDVMVVVGGEAMSQHVTLALC